MADNGVVGEVFVKLKLDDSQFNGLVDKSEKKSDSLGKTIVSGLGGAVATAGKVIAAGVATATTALGAMGAKSLSLYADYEQLVGGIDTLFKGSSQALQDYADMAYKTAGLSANQYMETVTSFSAGLIASLEGDTESAVEYANSAVVDMADNANKMGSSMESIQNAYQGFAKQNFTMLDNLKLGYGGTKEEMQRLLDDAEKISGVEYDITSFADITAAIHVMQEEMGIAGATAEEAEKTISGSVASMKSAFENLLTGLGNSDADIKQLTGDLIDSFNNVITNIMPVVENILGAMPEMVSGLLDAVGELLPVFIDVIAEILPIAVETIAEIIPLLITTLVEQLPTLIETISGIIPTILETLLNMLPMLVEAALGIIITLANGIAEMLPELIPTIVDVILQILDVLIENIPLLVEAAIAIILGLMYGILEALPMLIERMPEIIVAIVEALIESLPLLTEAALEIILELRQGILDFLPDLILMIPEMVKDIATAFIDAAPALWEAGKDLIEGLIDGMNAVDFISAIGDIADTVVGGFKDIFEIHSPSRLIGREVGEPVMDAAIPDAKKISSAMKGMGSAIKGAAQNMGGALSSGSMAAAGAGMVTNTFQITVNMSGATEEEANMVGTIIGNKSASILAKQRGLT